jgi:hypothetical protein
MGNCISVGAAEVSDEDKRRHREAEKSLKEVRVETTTLFVVPAYIRLFWGPIPFRACTTD